VYCIERRARCALWTSLAGLSLLAGCSTTSTGGSQTESAATPRPTARVSSSGGSSAPTFGVPASAGLPPPGTVRNWSEVRLQAARRLVSANPGLTYMGTVPDILLAIPVLEVELHADGSIRRIDVLRKPGQALDTIKLATDALYRAAPFGDVSRLPKPWRFTETFLFDDDRKFKPRTLDQ
jgi:hypothetical protein